MSDIQADLDGLRNFVTIIRKLVTELTATGKNPFVPPDLSSGSYPDFGQVHNPRFQDAQNLYSNYDDARRQIIGDGQATGSPTPAGSFVDFVNRLTLLMNEAQTIQQRYHQAGREDVYSAQMVNQALNEALTAGQGGSSQSTNPALSGWQGG